MARLVRWIFPLFFSLFFLSLSAAEGGGDSLSSSSFTGRVLRNRVRLRSQASLDSEIIQEMNKGKLLRVVGKEDSWYRVQVPEGIKAYIFRTYVLDGQVEGSHVNVRLAPSTEAPILAQLNTGDRVDGKICESNAKWLEITPPQQAYFYVAEEYVENIGSPELITSLQTKRDSAIQDLRDAYANSEFELKKSFEDIDPSMICEGFESVIACYQDLPEVVNEAREALQNAHEAYLQKKIHFLESVTKDSAFALETRNDELEQTIQTFQQRLLELEDQLQVAEAFESNLSWSSEESSSPIVKSSPPSHSSFSVPITNTMQNWQPNEEEAYARWAELHGDLGMERFYQEEHLEAKTLSGVVEVYGKPVYGKPGDYLLINPKNHVPIAFLYSVRVDLKNQVGKAVTVQGSPRPDNNFAFPAYHVLSVQ